MPIFHLMEKLHITAAHTVKCIIATSLAEKYLQFESPSMPKSHNMVTAD